jgi:undecaprenyl-diphosphatase
MSASQAYLHPLYDWFGLNQVLFRWINGLHAPWWDSFMLAVTAAADHRVFPIYVAAALGLAFLFARFLPMVNVVVFGIGYALNAAVIGYLKDLFAFPRPLAVLGAQAVTVLGSERIANSFPSGHATFAFLIAAALTPGMHRGAQIALWSFAGLAALSRIVVGAHFPADVVAGALIGALTAIVVRLALRLLSGARGA